MFSIELEKRGLSHVHILLWLEQEIIAESIDHIIYSELPDPHLNIDLYQVIKVHVYLSIQIHPIWLMVNVQKIPQGIFKRSLKRRKRIYHVW